MKCSAAGCEREAQRRQSQRCYYCIVHYRLARMRANAQQMGKYAPSYSEMEALIPDPLVCPECDLEMTWGGKPTDPRSATISLQHWRDGTLSMMCHSCNAKRQVRDELAPEGYKRCYKCGCTKPHSDFTIRRASADGLAQLCRACVRIRDANRV